MTDTKTCPCCSGKSFSECCEPVIQNRSASTALTLMRSRYSAYALSLIDYLIETTSPSRRSEYNAVDLKKWADTNDWTKLEIIAAKHGKINDEKGIVEFKTHFIDEHRKPQIHHERSNFEQKDGMWYYIDGSFNPNETDLMKKISRNDPCPCGSGKKFKKCCG